MIKVASYCRVSTDHFDQTNSFEAQKRYFRHYIENQPDWELYRIYADEGITGTNTKKRTQFNRMINDAYEGKFQMIITKEVSRFSRNILDTIAYTRELKAIGIGVIFATDRINTLEPEAEMLLSYLASMAQEESRRTSSRVVWGQTRRMEQGIVFGHSLLGYTVKNGKMEIEPKGAEVVRLIFHKYAAEQMSTSEIQRFLIREGYQTHNGNKNWTSAGIIKLLKNEKYTGDLIQKKTYTPDFLSHAKKTNRGEVPMVILRNHHEPIVTREIWEMAQNRLQMNNKHGEGEGGHSNRYLFSGKIICGECGSHYVGRYKYRKDGTKIRRWSCGTSAYRGATTCSIGKLVRDDDALQMLKTAVRSLPVDRKAIVNNITALALDAIRNADPFSGNTCKQLQQEIDQILQKKEAVMDSYFSNEITKEEMNTMKCKYDLQISELRQKQAEAEQRNHQNSDPQTLRTCIAAEVTGILNGECISDVFCKSVLDNITVFKDRHMELRFHNLPHVFHYSE